METDQKILEKQKTLVHYISHKAVDPTILGATKLNKVLWFIDTSYYRKYKKSLTGLTYIKHQFGPIPEQINSIVNDLVNSQRINHKNVIYYGRHKEEFISLCDPDIDSFFIASEIELIDKVFNWIVCENTANSASDLTHGNYWKSCKIGAEFPLYSVYAGSIGEINKKHLNWVESLGEL